MDEHCIEDDFIKKVTNTNVKITDTEDLNTLLKRIGKYKDILSTVEENIYCEIKLRNMAKNESYLRKLITPIRNLFDVKGNIKYIKDKKTPIHYEMINFFYDFSNNGYVLKVINSREEVYYNGIEKTKVPCINGELLIISDYNSMREINTYTLVQTDFTLDKKYKIIMIKDDKDAEDASYISAKYILYEYMRENEMIEIINTPYKEYRQIPDLYSDIIIGAFEKLENDPIRYTREELLTILLDNITLSENDNSYLYDEKDLNVRVYAEIMTEKRAEFYLDMIFKNEQIEKLSVIDLIKYVKQYKENYYYNIY